MTRTRRQFLASGGAAGLSFLPGWLPFVGGDSDDTESTDDRSPTLAEREDQYGMTIDYPEGGSRNTDRRLSPIATQCSSQWDCTHTACSTTTASTSTRTTGTNSPTSRNPVRRGQPPRRPRADDRSGRLGRCDRPSDVHVLPPPRGQHFWSPSHPSAPSAGDGRADHVQLRIVPPWHNYAVVEGTPSQPVSFRDVQGDADASHLRTWETQGIFDPTADEGSVESPHRTGPRIVVGRVDD